LNREAIIHIPIIFTVVLLIFLVVWQLSKKIIIKNMYNIPSTIQDPKYRYRMPKMQLKIESKGNGIKTNIVNLGDVATYLRTNAEYILKWFGN